MNRLNWIDIKDSIETVLPWLTILTGLIVNKATPGSLPKLLHTSPPIEEKTKTEETNLRIHTDDQYSESLEQEVLNSLKQQPSQKQEASKTKPNPAVNQEENNQHDQTHPAGDVKDITSVADSSTEDQSRDDGPDQKVIEVEPHLKEEVTEIVPHLKELMTETGLRLSQLDELYNISKVTHHVDLHNVTFLDNYYRYNYQVYYRFLLSNYFSF